MINHYKLLVITAFLSSCSSLPPVAYLDIAKLGYTSVFGYPEQPITKEIYDTREFSFAKANIGNSPQNIIVLLNTENQLFQWLSQDNIRLYTEYGRIVRVIGLEKDFSIRNPVNKSLFAMNKNDTYYETIDLFSPDLFGSSLKREIISVTKSKSQFLGNTVSTILIKEKIALENIGWKEVNVYEFFNDGRPFRTLQSIHPNLPKIKLEFYIK